MTPVMIKGLGQRRSDMLKAYFVEHILLVFFLMDICSPK